MNEEIPAPSTPDHKDRKTGLMVFGVLTMCLGGICALFVPLMFISDMVARRGAFPQSHQSLIPAMAIYAAMALLLFTLGIGSIKARRWARALLLVFSWSWLITGIISATSTWFVMTSPQFTEMFQAAAKPAGAPALSPHMQMMILATTVGVQSFVLVVLPIAWLIFYAGKHVKATCEAYSPEPSWTDRCPLPVLAVVLWIGLAALSTICLAAFYHGVLPLFGVFVSGPIGAAVCILLTVFWAYSAWAAYKLKPHGWWMLFIAMALLSLSAVITYSRHEITEVYRLMGYPEQQIAMIQKFSFLKSEGMVLVMLFCMALWLGYLIWIRRYFPKANPV